MSPKLLYRSTIPKPDDPDVFEPICDAIRKGHSQASAAYMAGIHEDTLYHWRYQGEAELREAAGRWIPWEELGSHARLVIRLKEAQAGLMDYALDRWREGGKDWAAWATLLERRFPQDFGRYNRVEVEQRSVTLSIQAQLPAESLPAILQLAAREAEKLQDGGEGASTPQNAPPLLSAPQDDSQQP